MLAEEQLAATERRYQARTGDRMAGGRSLGSSILYADSADRVRRRLARLAAPTAPAAAVETAPPPVPELVGLERLIGVNNLIDTRFLQIGVAVARTVARIVIQQPNGLILGYGTGFLVSPRLLLTNNHVLRTAAHAQASIAEFGYEQDLTGQLLPGTGFGLDPATLFVTDPGLDYTLVAVHPTNTAGASLGSYGWSRLVAAEGKAIKGEFVNIIQHPGGQPKALALRDNQLVDVLDQFLHYQTDTAPGSSGAPVFNDQWEVIALHHSGVPRRDPAGHILTRTGDRWTSAMDETQIDWIANEGARISRILAHLTLQPLTGTAATLRAELLSAPLPPLGGEQAATSSTGSVQTQQQSTLSADGTLTVSIPLQLTLRLGDAPVPPTSTLPSPAPSLAPSPVPASVVSSDVATALGTLAEAAERPYYEAVVDQAAQVVYYAPIGGELDPTQRFEALAELVRSSHTTSPRYRPSVELYPWIDLHPDLKLRAIYSDLVLEPAQVILEDLRIEAEVAAAGVDPDSPEALEAAGLVFNCEHVVPQSWFSKREPMRGDLHHLFACEPGCNSFRGNIPYFDFADFPNLEVIRNQCGRRENARFEPEAGKGPVARATLYFLLRYPGHIEPGELPAERVTQLLEWHDQFPPGDYERHRNAAIFDRQGNRNPLIDHPEWAAITDFTHGLTPQ